MCGRNTENQSTMKNEETTVYERRQQIIMRFTYEEKYIIFNDIGKGRRKKEIYEGVEVVIAVN